MMTSTEAHDNILAALRALAAACDGAVTQDKKGFNGPDSFPGKLMASKQRLSRKQLESAFELLGKYRKQLSEKHGIELVAELPPQKTIATPDRSNPLKTAMDALWQDAERIVGQHPAEKLIAESVAKAQPFWTEGDEILDGIFATASQASALNALWAWYHDPEAEPEFVLIGYPGTGKTVLVQAFLKALNQKRPSELAVFTAPTNQATKVLASMVKEWGLGVDCKTAASLLGLKPVRDRKTGLEIFKPDRKGSRNSSFYDLLVVDEASMVSDDQQQGDVVGLFGLIRNGLSRHPIPGQNAYKRALYVGDSAQLPPVNQVSSSVFAAIKNRAILTEVMRYGGAVLELATQIRENLNSTAIPTMQSVPEDGLWVIPAATLNRQLIKAAGRNAFAEGGARALAWTNRRTEAMAALIRREQYGENPPQIVEGEPLIVGSPYVYNWRIDGKEHSEVLLKTSEEYKVRSVNPGTLQIDGIESPALGIGPDDSQWDILRVEFDCGPFFIQCKDAWGDAMGITVQSFPVLADHERTRYKAASKRLYSICKERREWAPYWALQYAFADLRSAVSLTVHKSQGSTIKGFTFVDAANIYQCKDSAEYFDPMTESMKPSKMAQHLFYTAITRAGGNLVIGL